MAGGLETVKPGPAARPRRRAVDRLVSVFLLVLMALGSFAIWTVVPAASLKVLLPRSESTAYHLVIGLIGVPAAMIVFGMGLFWLNGLYLRVNGAWRPGESGDLPHRVKGPLESMMLWSFLVAVIAMGFWFFVLAENPSSQVV